MAYMRDFRGERLDSLEPLRDLPGLLAYFDADDLPGANGTAVPIWGSRVGTTILNISPATKPTCLTAAANGHPLLRFGTSAYLRDTTSILVGGPSGGWPQPISLAFVFRAVNVALSSQNMLVVGGSAISVRMAASGQALYANAGADITVQGPELNDGNLHVCVAVLTTGGWQIYIDGYLTGSALTQQQSTGALTNLFLGPGLSVPLPAGQFFDYGDVAVMAGSLTPSRVDAVTQALADKFGIDAPGRQVNGVAPIDVTDANGQQCRLWLPPGNGPIKLAIWSHPYTQNEQIASGYTSYPWVHALVQEGWGVIATRQHGDSWGNDNAVADIAAAHTLAGTYRTVTDTILIAGSMGGLASALAVARGTLPDLRGVALSDAVLDLVWAYTGNSGGYQAGINTAYGISAVGSIPAANDPMQQPGSAFTSVPWRFYASTTDGSVAKTSNTDAFRTKIAAAPESGLVTHNTSGHLNAGAFPPADFVAFVRRCVS